MSILIENAQLFAGKLNFHVDFDVNLDYNVTYSCTFIIMNLQI